MNLIFLSSITSYKHVVHENLMGGSSMIGLTLVIAVSERDMPGFEPGPLAWHTSTLTNELQEVRYIQICVQIFEANLK